jgi:cell filamentation protein
MSEYFAEDDILRYNKLGIRDADELKRAEEEIVAARMVELIEGPIGSNFDFSMLKAMHEKLFSDIYDFAGTVRTVRIAKDESVFCYPEYIDENQERIFDLLEKQNYLQNLPREDFVRKFALLNEELNALHPFREGNGRVIRLFLKQLAEQAGWYIAYEDMEPDKLLEADIKAFHGDLEPLINLIQSHITEYQTIV